jgi:predicted enzyme related to lactoylglutathione lyase
MDEGASINNPKTLFIKEKPMANPFWHIELRTKDVAKAKQFYKNLFDWQWEEVRKGYMVFRTGEEVTGGITNGTHNTSHWVPIIEVADVRAATRKAVQLGAKVLEEVTEEGEIGRYTMVADPTGAPLYLFQPKKK